MNLTKIAKDVRTVDRILEAPRWEAVVPPVLALHERTPLHEMWAHWTPAQRRAWAHGVSLRVMFA